jgi:paraquat-inducible protein B
MPPTNPDDQTPAAADAVIRTKRSLSIVWLVPLVAVVVGAWLVYKAVSEKGPTITITFKSAEGLEAGKTKLKYKDVEIGVVDTIELSPKLDSVVVTADLDKSAEPFLTEQTRFWVVRARVAGGEVSGLGTIFSGAYIAIEPGIKGKSARHFAGLEIPPVVTTDQTGRHFLLKASRLGSLNYGSPLYYRQIQVGQVEGYELDPAGTGVNVKVFVEAPYQGYVRQNTRFWLVSGLDVELSAQGVRVDTASVVSLMIGGIAFNVLAEDEDPEAEAAEGATFHLYNNYNEALEQRFTGKARYLLFFDGSVRGLQRDAPVEFRGLPLGRVVSVKLEADPAKVEFRIPVVIEIEPERMGQQMGTPEKREAVLKELVAKGFRAKLKPGSLLTGKLYVDLDFYRDAKKAQVVSERGYLVIPTIPTTIDEITDAVTRFVEKLDKLPLDKIVRDLDKTVSGIEKLVNAPELRQSLESIDQILKDFKSIAERADAETLPGLNTSIQRLQETLTEVKGLISADAPLQYDLRRTLEELSGAGRAVRQLADYLERNPEALIYGKGNDKR